MSDLHTHSQLFSLLGVGIYIASYIYFIALTNAYTLLVFYIYISSLACLLYSTVVSDNGLFTLCAEVFLRKAVRTVE